MRYQVVVLASEIGDAINIESLTWKRFPSPEDQGTFQDLKVYVGLCDTDVLGTTFDDNFMPGTKTLVLSGSPYSTPVVPVNGWFDITFDTPYWYNGQDNLLIEVEWSSGDGSLYSWSWEGSGIRCIFAPYGQSTASVSNPNVPHLRINGTLELSQSTFGGIKASFN
jgi:hypothetical protein